MAVVRKRRYVLIGIGLLSIGMATGIGVGSWVWRPSNVVLGDGDTLAAFDPDDIVSVRYASRDTTLTAQRVAPDAGFAVMVTFEDGRPSQHCEAPADLFGHLAVLSDWTVRRSLSMDDLARDFPTQIGVLDLRDRIVGEPTYPMLLFTDRRHDVVAVVLDGIAAEVRLRVVDLVWLTHGCGTPPVKGRTGVR